MRIAVTIKTAATSVVAIVASTAAANAQNAWEGFYAGLGVNSFSGDVGSHPVTDDAYSTGKGANFSLFAGHNWAVGASGNTIVGVELATGSGPSGSTNVSGYGDASLSLQNITDFKLRAGQSFGKTLIYGFVGGSMGSIKLSDGGESSGPKISTTGGIVGIGAEYMVTEQFSVGLEYVHREMSGIGYGEDYGTGDIKLNSIGLRGAFNF